MLFAGEKKVNLRDFKTIQIARLFELKKELLEKYPERADRINYIVDILMSKIEYLRTFSLTNYLHTVYRASMEFKEFETLMPDAKTIEELIKEGESNE
jgi:uncharacterized protein YdhG (YjbR/CyaY superfamily)